MTTLKHESVREESGFTLVELAIVMVIIGIILGGILKGQEVITNARVSSTIALAKAVDTATSTFRDIYDTLPGDMAAATTRLPGCANLCAANGNGDGRLTNVPGDDTGENLAFFSHLAAADLVTGVTAAGTTGAVWGEGFPSAPINGGFVPGYSTGAANQLTANELGAGRAGHYIMLQAVPTAAGGAVVTPSQAFRMDNKLDDSQPGSGSVIGIGGATCGTATDYDEAETGENCAVAIRIQG